MDKTNTIGYYIDNKEAIISSLNAQKEKLRSLMFSCSDYEYSQIQLRIKQIENSIRFQTYYI